MPRYEKLSIPRDAEISGALVAGRLGELILANTADLELPTPLTLEPLNPPLTESEEQIAVGAINGLTSTEIGRQFPRGQSAPKTIERKLSGIMDRLHASNRAQLARHLFCLGIAVPDEGIPDEKPRLTPTTTLILGLRTHGLTNAQIVEAAQPWLSDGSVKRALTAAADELVLSRGVFGVQRRDIASTATYAFEQNVFSLNPDLVMSPDFLVPGVQRLLDPAHELVRLPQ